MKSPIIGIVSNSTKDSKSIIYDNVIRSVELSGGEPIGLISNIDAKVGKEVLGACDGFILQGGREIEDLQLEILEYAYRNNKPVLGICLGFQLIATHFFGIGSVKRIEHLDNNDILQHFTFIEDENDKKECVHKVNFTSGSILHSIFGGSADVNSRHIKTVVNIEEPFIIAANAEDGIIEAVEHSDSSNFIVGVQWHPEDLDHMKPLFDLFIQRCTRH